MKNIISSKKVIIGILSFAIIGTKTVVFATDSVLETNTSNNNIQTATEVTTTDLNSASTIPVDTNTDTSTSNSTTATTIPTDTNSTTTSNGVDTNSDYKTVDEDDTDKMPQTGIEDSYVGILLIVFVAIALFTFKKMKDYRNV